MCVVGGSEESEGLEYSESMFSPQTETSERERIIRRFPNMLLRLLNVLKSGFQEQNVECHCCTGHRYIWANTLSYSARLPADT